MANSENVNKNYFVILAAVLVTLCLVGILAYGILTSTGVVSTEESSQPSVFISITQPRHGESLDLTWRLNIRGQSGGLSGETLVVQVLDAAGNILAQESTRIIALEADRSGSGDWSVELNIEAPSGSQGQILAFSPSPGGESWIAEDRIEVGFGEDPFKDDLVRVEDHLWRLITLNGRPSIQDTLLTLQFDRFEASGFGGCNNFRTTFIRKGTDLNFGFSTSTAKDCELPAGVMSQEAAYFNALESIASAQIEGAQFSLYDGSGMNRLIYDAVIMGTIIGPGAVQIPEDAVVYIHLIDSSISNFEDSLISAEVINDANQLPISFELIYNPKQIIDNHTYLVEVQIEDSTGNMIFQNSSDNQVITGNDASVINLFIEAAP